MFNDTERQLANILTMTQSIECEDCGDETTAELPSAIGAAACFYKMGWRVKESEAWEDGSVLITALCPACAVKDSLTSEVQK